jgi:hypothetical protein
MFGGEASKVRGITNRSNDPYSRGQAPRPDGARRLGGMGGGMHACLGSRYLVSRSRAGRQGQIWCMQRARRRWVILKALADGFV